jgi:Asp-tRNA(Asn)/Glu-tRNA(Gln) amidotransferase C subunit
MKISELEDLGNLSQIRIRKEEFNFFLKTFDIIELMITKSSISEPINKVRPMDRILDNHLSLNDLENFQNIHRVFRLSKEEISLNASLTEDGRFFVSKVKK